MSYQNDNLDNEIIKILEDVDEREYVLEPKIDVLKELKSNLKKSLNALDKEFDSIKISDIMDTLRVSIELAKRIK